MKRRELIKNLGLSGLAFALTEPIPSLLKYEYMADNKNFDVIIIGGSYSGLSAAMALGRSLRKVLIIDSNEPCNRFTPYSHNFITHDGKKPGEITQNAKLDVMKYETVTFLQDFAINSKEIKNGFSITTKSSKEFIAKKLIFATGIKDLIPNIKGFSECWGKSIIHCPYCHGYEFRNLKTAIYADANKVMHLVPLVKNLTNDLTVIVKNILDFNDEEIKKLEKKNIKLIDNQINLIEHQEGKLQNIVFDNNNRISFDVLYATIPFKQHSQIPEELGCKLTEYGLIEVNNFQKTSVEGMYACGDNSGMMRSVANAVYTGNLTGAMVNDELAKEQF